MSRFSWPVRSRWKPGGEVDERRHPAAGRRPGRGVGWSTPATTWRRVVLPEPLPADHAEHPARGDGEVDLAQRPLASPRRRQPKRFRLR